jgi:hypothetical protein
MKQVAAMIEILQPYLKELTGYEKVWIEGTWYKNENGKARTYYEVMARDIGQQPVVISAALTPRMAFGFRFATLMGQKVSELLARKGEIE